MEEKRISINDLHLRLARGVLGAPLNEDDALALMVLLHTHRVQLREPILVDRPAVIELAAITQRDAAEVVAGCWPDRADKDRTKHHYWYRLFNNRTPFEIVEDIPSEWIGRVTRLRDELAKSPMVDSLVPDD